MLLGQDSAFSAEQILNRAGTFYARKSQAAVQKGLFTRVRKRLPRLTRDWNREAFTRTIREALGHLPGPRLALEVGAGEKPGTIPARYPEARWLCSDVDLAWRPDLVADVTGLPFPDNTFALTYADQVLEHVCDLYAAAQELQRVTQPGGLVVIGIPFNHPWHGVPYDFFRCTPSGVRALFRSTETVYLGAGAGPWVSLACQLDRNLINLFAGRRARAGAALLSRFLFGGLKYLDRLATAPRHLATAGSVLFVGRKRERPFTTSEILSELRERFPS